ncbi:hypothetical protein N5P37_007732 [Trichoderma harzianum]|nr:hypothetical protein N5P37_007732 [Trichoderma harzianum]
MAAMERQSTPWETLQAFEDERLSTNSSVMRESLYGPFYAHLPNVYLDWELEGYVCRVLGSKCYGLKLPKPSNLMKHLRSPYHLRHDEMRAPQRQSPPPRTNDVRQNTKAVPDEVTTTNQVSTSIRQNTKATPNEATTPVELLNTRYIPRVIEITESQTGDLRSEISTPSKIEDSQVLLEEITATEALLSEIEDS